jgi:pimeloyl-ACP methyl ester carboxylesterase
MTNFVLIHGSWHGAWCWFKVAPRLRAAGHHVEAIDLPGHGRDRTPADRVSIDSYVDAIHAAIDRAPGLTPEPFAPSKARMRVTEERYGGVPRSYIRLTRDRAVSPALQDRMLAALPRYAVRSIEASHSAYFSRPDELTQHLQELAALMRPAATRALA